MDPLSTNTLTDRKPSAQQDYGVATGTRPPSAMESVFPYVECFCIARQMLSMRNRGW